MTNDKAGPYLKYALFCHDTQETPDGELTLSGIIDLVDLPVPTGNVGTGTQILAEVDVNLAFCIGGATPGNHHLMVIQTGHQPKSANPSGLFKEVGGAHEPPSLGQL